MNLLAKLQIKPDMRLVVLDVPVGVELAGAGEPETADAVLAFVTSSSDLSGPAAEAALAAARRDAVAWLAYPKAKQLGTDLNRDSLAAMAIEQGVRPVRQIAIDDTWSALRFRPGR